MALYPKARRTLALAIATSALIVLLPAASSAQGRGNGILEQIAQLEALIAQQAEAIAALQAGLAAETAARVSADTTLQNNINAEAAARQAADSTLQNNIDAEAAARAAADTTLQNNINAEAAARQAADSTLQNNVDAEAAARAAADTTLQNNIDAEAAARQAADSTLQNNINADAVVRAAADTTLQNNIDAEAAARAAADTTLQDTIVDSEVGVITISGIVLANGAVYAGHGFTVTRLAAGVYKVSFPAGSFDIQLGTGGASHRLPVSSFAALGSATVVSTGLAFGPSTGTYEVTIQFSADTNFQFIVANSK